MDSTRIILLAAASGAIGLWLLLPRTRDHAQGHALRHAIGVVLSAASLGALISRLPGLGTWTAEGVFWTVAGVTIAAAVATVASRDPIHAALWFGMTLLGTAALFLFAGALFLAVATVTVYAGAILVTFLFVLMLAQPEGRASYDRTSTEAFLSAATGAALVAVLTIALGRVLDQPGAMAIGDAATGAAGPSLDVARLGAVLFTRHLIAVEVAGVLLLTALVGAAVILARRTNPPAEDEPREDDA